MAYLVDTNAISELARRRPSPHVRDWFAAVPNELLYVSVLTLGELRKAVEALPPNARHERLSVWLEAELPRWFGERVLPIDAGVADRWGRLLAAAGRPLPAIDSLLAATALHHDLRIVTRNTADFALPGVAAYDPWAGGGTGG